MERSQGSLLANLSHARDKPFESSAQNLEDVVLWRVLHDIQRGCYVDVGAFDPVIDSITWPYYQRGWRGVVIEPVPALAAALRLRRPHDVTIEAAAGAKTGTARLFVSESTSNSTLARDVADRVAATGIAFSEVGVRVAPLDDLLEEAGLAGRTIHFCTIDVEGSEADALAGFDLERWGPWILVVEATEPNRPQASHQSWEQGVLGAGYRFCLFDGLNRFYVHPDKADDFAEQLSYPACVFDEGFERTVKAARRADELERIAFGASRRADELERAASLASSRADELDRRVHDLEEIAGRLSRIERENAELAERANEAAAELSVMRGTISWRVTRPLRAATAASRRMTRRRLSMGRQARGDDALERIDRDLKLAFARRVAQAAETLHEGLPPVNSHVDVKESLATLAEALTASSAPDQAKAWLALVAVDGCFPGERSVEHMARVLRMNGPSGLRQELLDRFARGVEQGLTTKGELDVLRNRVVVDVTHTAMATDLHTGIQRVVRETVARWIDSRRPMDLIRFDLQRPAARLLSSEESERFMSWREHVGLARAGPHTVRKRGAANTLVPWQCDLVVPELPFEAERTAAYRGLGTASVLRSLSMVGYDVVPIIAAEKVIPKATTDFGEYLSVVKHANRLSTISRTSQDAFNAFAMMARAEGFLPPTIEAHELPAEAPELDLRKIAAVRTELGVGAGPIILVVGSHEPRKNHLTVLEAAERLWARGDCPFELLFLGWSSWLSEDFDDLVSKLVSAGRPVVVRKRCSEEQLWAAYRFARFTVFPSLLEGYGLPIAESLASGTPVITSNYGSMAEVAEKGGCLLVDPRNVDEIERAMAQLLDDDDALGKLRDQALRVDTGSWEDYASRLWDFLTAAAVEKQVESTAPSKQAESRGRE